ncbi:MAG TPA: cytochrome d ubiquinol oxidase subunit II [Verrucomicrobiae bacterium]|nr:cytochrome d ubiquinol oxidase subunit II [Verrucomicrobiae bacterium]
MSEAAFGVVAFMLAAYVVLDGYDLGVAAISPLLGRTDRERAALMESIGPFWNGNEVWLIAAGGALFALFPKAYAVAFSGFYLPLIVVLWMLMFRGIAMELRGHYDSEIWHQFWDAAFALSSFLLILLFGVALGNLLRGVPLDAHGYFAGTFAFLLNPYALLVGLFAVAALAAHGALFAAARIDGAPAARARRLMRVLWWIVLALDAGVTAATFAVRGAPSAPWLYVLPLLSLAALGGILVLAHRAMFGAFLCSCAFLATLLAEAAGSIFPYIVPAYPLGAGGLSIYAAAPSPASLAVALCVTIAGGAVAIAYGAYVTRKMAGKVRVE